MKTNFKYYGAAILWALFIFILCSIKMGEVSHSPMFFAGFDKLTHCGMFFVLVVFYCMGFIRKRDFDSLTYSVAATVTIVAILYGGLIELLQLYIFTWRSGEWADWFSDAVGAGMGIFGVWLTIFAIKNVKK